VKVTYMSTTWYLDRSWDVRYGRMTLVGFERCDEL
jgi:hypothetical protein